MSNSAEKVNDIGERGLIRLISKILGGLGSELLSGEDDAVAVSLKKMKSSVLVINNDMLVSTTDMPKQMTLYEAARKAIEMSVSDIFVKGAVPKWGIVSLGFPDNLELNNENGFKGLIKGLKDGFDNYNILYLGGDLNESKEIIISCTILGEATKGKVIPRSGARVNDIIVSTGEFGKTGCGFAILIDNAESKNISEEWKNNFINSVLRPKTTPEYGKILLKNGWVNASADSSDGIYPTLSQICEASNVGAQLYWKNLPIADGVIEFSKDTGLDIEDLIFFAGEEFLHLYTIPESKFDKVKKFFKALNMPFYKIGRIIGGKPRIILDDKFDQHTVFISKKKGYEHFKKEIV